jgi:hypothetical protein
MITYSIRYSRKKKAVRPGGSHTKVVGAHLRVRLRRKLPEKEIGVIEIAK